MNVIFSTNPSLLAKLKFPIPRLQACGKWFQHRMAVLFSAAWILSSCAQLDALLVTATPIHPTGTPPPSPTIIWFPPSATPTRSALTTKLPTPERRPGLGEKLITDNFSNDLLWDTASSDEASAIIRNNQITLSVQSGVYMLSVRKDLILSDSYAEITAQPSLCRGEDSYGVLARASASSYYRFALSCNGTARAERVSSGTRLTLQQPIPSGDVPPGAPGEVRVGLWAVGRELRLFLNGRYQFTISDPSFPSGSLGVFVRSSGETAAVVSFSDLTIHSVDYILPTPTLYVP